MNPYLHFGHISPVKIAALTKKLVPSSKSRDYFLKELIVIIELALNMIFYNENYDNYGIIPNFVK
jgi:deoxyribodipyrimidine photo-lyase